MTPEERAANLARAICACTCHGTKSAPADNSGPLKDGSHYANCPVENEAWVAEAASAAIRDAVKVERETNVALIDGARYCNPRSNRERGFNDACDDFAAAIRSRP